MCRNDWVLDRADVVLARNKRQNITNGNTNTDIGVSSFARRRTAYVLFMKRNEDVDAGSMLHDLHCTL